MPGRDRTGPYGDGALTGRGFGPCAGGAGAPGYPRRTGFGRGCGRGIGYGRGANYGRGTGYGRRYADGILPEETSETALKREKAALKDRIRAIDKTLEDL